MTQEQINSNELDRQIRNALASSNALVVPPGLSEKTIQKLEKKVLLRELILELLFKVGLVLGSLAILAGVLVWINGRGFLTGLYTQFFMNSQLIISLLLLVFITALIDQVGLRFYSSFKKEISLKG